MHNAFTQWWKLWILAVVLLASACGSTKSASGNRLLNNKQFSKKLQQPATALLDIRTVEEYLAGHLKNAALIDYNSGDFTAKLPQLDPQKTYLLYCRTGKRSDKAAIEMKAAGFKKVYQLKDGITAWNGAVEKQKK